MDSGETLEHDTEFVPGDEVQITEGPFRGLAAVVRRYLPAAQRVQVLLEFLGRSTPVEVGAFQLNGARRYPRPLLADAMSPSS